jgi:hypothetical protein
VSRSTAAQELLLPTAVAGGPRRQRREVGRLVEVAPGVDGHPERAQERRRHQRHERLLQALAGRRDRPLEHGQRLVAQPLLEEQPTERDVRLRIGPRGIGCGPQEAAADILRERRAARRAHRGEPEALTQEAAHHEAVVCGDLAERHRPTTQLRGHGSPPWLPLIYAKRQSRAIHSEKASDFGLRASGGGPPGTVMSEVCSLCRPPAWVTAGDPTPGCPS